MNESSSKRPPSARVAEAPRPIPTPAAAAVHPAPAAPSPPQAQPALAGKGNPPAMPRPLPMPAAAAIAPTPVALPPLQPQPALARKGNPTAMPDSVALFDAFAHGAEAFADEMAGLAQTGFANAAETAKAMLGAKTLTEAFEINAGFVRKSLDTMLTGSVRLAEITARLAEKTLQPLMPAR